MSDEEDYEDDLIEDNDNVESLTASNLLSPTPIGGRGKIVDDDKYSVESYGSYNSVESDTAEKTSDSVYSEIEPKEEDRSSSDLQQQLYSATKQLVKEGEKNVSLALELEKYKDELSGLKAETESFRSVLLRGINGGVTDSTNYTHVGLDELLRLRIQESSSSTQDFNSVDAPLLPQQCELARNESSVGIIQMLEHKLVLGAQQNDALQAKLHSLKGELESKEKDMEGIENLRVKVSQMVQRLRTEREVKFKVQKDLSTEKSKVEALSDHIEKLMVHLKHEAIAKARSLADQSRVQREMEMMKTRNENMAKKNERKDQVITELRESAKLLEDQLRLMDEKYMELRSKLDWTRTQTERIVKKKEEETNQLRMKFQILEDDFRGDSSLSRKPRPKVTIRNDRAPAIGEGRSSVIELKKVLAASKRGGGAAGRSR